MKLKKLTIISFGLVILISMIACAPQDTGLDNNLNRMSTQTRVNQNRVNTNWNNDDRMIDNLDKSNLDNGMVRNNRMTTSLGKLNTNAKDLAKKISDLPEVDKASVVLHNDTALVGVKLKGNNNNTLNNNRLNTSVNNVNNNISTALRNKIENMVKDETNVENVSITSDPNLITRINNISTGMTNQVGNDIRDFTDDIEDLIRDIVPGNSRVNDVNINR
ncbi:hypothetical protein E9840_01030 [Tissierella creatinini]|nr:hypothetical protein E9840_01030 [Tissierella creatinini]TJX69065.1 hypothetical protein E8P77_00090 [Soehngenia saccharolytica]